MFYLNLKFKSGFRNWSVLLRLLKIGWWCRICGFIWRLYLWAVILLNSCFRKLSVLVILISFGWRLCRGFMRFLMWCSVVWETIFWVSFCFIFWNSWRFVRSRWLDIWRRSVWFFFDFFSCLISFCWRFWVRLAIFILFRFICC